MANALWVALVDCDGDLVDLLDGEPGTLAQSALNDPGSNSILDEALNLLEDLAGEEDNRGRAVANLGVLRARNVDKCPRGRVDNVQQFEDCRSVV